MALRLIRRFRELLDVDFGTPSDGDVPTYDAGSDSIVMGAVSSAGGPAGGVLAGTYPDPSFAADMATQAELDAHLADALDAHAATAIAFSPAGSISSTTVQAAIEEAVSEVVAGAPTGADYLVGTSNGGLSSEIVVGTSPGGELGGTWGSPTVDATHSGSSHASVQSAAEATAAAALAAHAADGTAIHGITDTAALVTTARTITAGAALTGGGSLAADRTLDVAVDGSTLEVSGDALRVKAGGIGTNEIASNGVGTAEITDGSVTPAKLSQHEVEIGVSDPNGVAITTGDGKAYFLVTARLNGLNLVGVAAAVTTVSSSGIPTVQIANVTDSVDMLSTKLTIDASEFTSYTAATPAVIDTTKDDVATGDILRVDVDVAGTGAKGLIVVLIFGP